jgi:2-amino-4-hydroxy-6-hydroxymethyldihydropteridine diphosphokinase
MGFLMSDEAAIFIAYGSNLSSASLNTSQAFAQVVNSFSGNQVKVQRVSRLWRSKAWPDPEDPPYNNAVLQVRTRLDPEELLNLLHGFEAEMGRVRLNSVNILRNKPRVLDLDLIAYGRVIYPLGGESVDSPTGLQLPHPRAHERGFVMGPLAEIAPDWVHPVLQKTATELYAQVSVGVDAHPATAEELAG